MTEFAPLRILQFNSLLTGGGTDDQCVKLACGLRQAGQQVSVAGPGGRDFSKVLNQLQVPFHEQPPRVNKFQLARAASRIIDAEGIQIIHGHHGRDLWLTILAARLSKRRPLVVLTRHLAKSPSSWLSRRYLLKYCDGLIAVSKFVEQVLKSGHHDPESPEKERHHRKAMRGDSRKIKVIYGGIDTDQFRPRKELELRKAWGLSGNEFVFAVAGGYGLPRGKGQREFLKAASRVHQQMPEARFLIIGRGNMKEILEKDIQGLGLSGKAWLTPYCHDMPAAMNALDCLVHPQIGTEAFGLVLLEAFACGKPVIASALDGIPEAFEAASFGKLTPPELIDELALAMKDIISPGFARPSPLSLHQRVAENFSLAAATQRVLDYYRELLSSHP